MKRKILGTFICTLLIATTVLPVVRTFEINQKSAIDFRFKSVFNPHPSYVPEDIALKDAAYHKSYDRFNLEWWYFEGIFDNGYSVIIGFCILSKNHFGFCGFSLLVYNNTKPEDPIRKIFPLKKCKVSEDFPSINVFEKQFMKLDRERYNNTGDWVYNISSDLKDISVRLQFQGTTKGYKGRILRGWYGPVLPKATVNGILILNGEQINVSGLGYHEHAWGIYPPVWEYGWHWGKIVSDSFSLFWVKMMQTCWREQQRFAILSQNQSDYIHIHPENIRFKATNYTINNRRIIPAKFILNITDPENSIYINLTMETINIHLVSGRINRYWRYHIRVNGQITYGSITETLINKIQIMELVRFPSLIPIY